MGLRGSLYSMTIQREDMNSIEEFKNHIFCRYIKDQQDKNTERSESETMASDNDFEIYREKILIKDIDL